MGVNLFQAETLGSFLTLLQLANKRIANRKNNSFFILIFSINFFSRRKDILNKSKKQIPPRDYVQNTQFIV